MVLGEKIAVLRESWRGRRSANGSNDYARQYLKMAGPLVGHTRLFVDRPCVVLLSDDYSSALCLKFTTSSAADE
jgi:hypothetical protein